MGGRYNRSRDPWTLFDQQTPNPVRDYLRYFYGQTLNYASSRVSFRSLALSFSWASRRPREGEREGGRGRKENGIAAHIFSSLSLPPPLLQKKKKHQGRCEGCEYRVDGIFIWNDASWDIQGIYPESTVEGVGESFSFLDVFSSLFFFFFSRSLSSFYSASSLLVRKGPHSPCFILPPQKTKNENQARTATRRSCR